MNWFEPPFAKTKKTEKLTDMTLIPDSHFGMSGSIQKHMLIYIVVIAITLTIFFDLSRIASIGAIFYLVMDMIVHWGVFKHLRKDINANGIILISALLLDLFVLFAFLWVKANSDIFVVIASAIGIVLVFAWEKWFLHWQKNELGVKIKARYPQSYTVHTAKCYKKLLFVSMLWYAILSLR